MQLVEHHSCVIVVHQFEGMNYPFLYVYVAYLLKTTSTHSFSKKTNSNNLCLLNPTWHEHFESCHALYPPSSETYDQLRVNICQYLPPSFWNSPPYTSLKQNPGSASSMPPIQRKKKHWFVDLRSTRGTALERVDNFGGKRAGMASYQLYGEF